MTTICSSPYESSLLLKNGSHVLVRSVVPADARLLQDLFGRISPESRYSRFLRHMEELPADLLDHFTHMDYVKKFALAGVVREDDEDVIVAVARYDFDAVEGSADLAVAVRDDWQHLGLGKQLLARIVAIGGAHGIRRFGSMIDPSNTIIRQMLQQPGYTVKYLPRDGFFQVEILVDAVS